MISPPSLEQVRRILETDRVWSAYALADLEPAEAARSTWFLQGEAVVLVYRGLTPPVLFAHGDSSAMARLVDRLPASDYVYTLRERTRARLGARLASVREVRMWRMVLESEAFVPPLEEETERLGPQDLHQMLDLFDEHEDRPDGFHPRQVEGGVFFGLRGSCGLACVAGTHILSQTYGIAAVGNVFTRPDARGRGLARAATGAVVKELLTRGFETIVLNVAQENEPAIRCYRRLGFREHCSYLEGLGHLMSGERAVKRREG